MADATAFDEVIAESVVGEGELSVGEAIEVGSIKSSRFIGSTCDRSGKSRDSRSFAIPEGALVTC